MPRRTSVAAGSGLAAGVLITVAAVDDVTLGDLPDVAVQTALTVCPLIAVTVVALATLRRWIAAHDQGHRQQIEELQTYREGMGEEFDRRSRELAMREDALNAHAALNAQQYRTLVDQLREARQERDEAFRERDRLREDFAVLADEYNGLVLGEIDERSAVFAPRRRSRASGVRDRRRERAAEVTAPVGFIGKQPQPEPTQHARPAEG